MSACTATVWRAALSAKAAVSFLCIRQNGIISMAKAGVTGWSSARLRAMVEATGFTQGEVADACGVTRGQLSHFINGHHEPSIQNLVLLAKGLGVTPNDLLGYCRSASHEKHKAAVLQRRVDAALDVLKGWC